MDNPVIALLRVRVEELIFKKENLRHMDDFYREEIDKLLSIIKEFDNG